MTSTAPAAPSLGKHYAIVSDARGWLHDDGRFGSPFSPILVLLSSFERADAKRKDVGGDARVEVVVLHD